MTSRLDMRLESPCRASVGHTHDALLDQAEAACGLVDDRHPVEYLTQAPYISHFQPSSMSAVEGVDDGIWVLLFTILSTAVIYAWALRFFSPRTPRPQPQAPRPAVLADPAPKVLLERSISTGKLSISICFIV